MTSGCMARGTVVEEPRIIGEAPALVQALMLADRFAATRYPVLIIGETGTGKELIAQRIHSRSGRAGPLIDVNCASLGGELADSLLFGHRRGAFSGAIESTKGHFQEADRGTLFLDELGSMPVTSQARLLRAIETGRVRGVGCDGDEAVDVRVVAAAGQNLDDLMRKGDFRLDLFQRLSVGVLRLPPLRQRRGDIPQLASYFAALTGSRLLPGAVKVIADYGWPGNIRELKAVITRAAVMSTDGMLSSSALEQAISLARWDRNEEGPLRRLGEDEMRIVAACEASSWDIPAAARTLEIGRSTLYRRLEAYGIRIPRRKYVQ